MIFYYILLALAIAISTHLFSKARAELTLEQKAKLYDAQNSYPLRKFFIFALLFLVLIYSLLAHLGTFAEQYLYLLMPAMIILGIGRSICYWRHLKNLGFLQSYLKATTISYAFLFIALSAIALHWSYSSKTDSYTGEQNISETNAAPLYWNGQWDDACSKCWPEPQTSSNNHCTPKDCVLQGYYYCKRQNPPLDKSNDPRIVDLIKKGECLLAR